jgi:hypothetical protein
MIPRILYFFYMISLVFGSVQQQAKLSREVDTFLILGSGQYLLKEESFQNIEMFQQPSITHWCMGLAKRESNSS